MSYKICDPTVRYYLATYDGSMDNHRNRRGFVILMELDNPDVPKENLQATGTFFVLEVVKRLTVTVDKNYIVKEVA